MIKELIRKLRVRQIARLRREAKHYEVAKHDWMRAHSHDHYIVVLALTPYNAVIRARRRGFGLNRRIGSATTDSTFAEWRVKEVGKSDHWRNITYF